MSYFFSALLISIPVVSLQYRNSVNDAIEAGESKVAQGCSDINVFLQKPISMVLSVTHYIETHTIQQTQIENYFEKLLAQEKEFSELYFSGTLPFKDGGFFYANDRWNPPSDYDQTTRAWYKAGISSQTFSISDPYLDSVTNSMVAALSTKVMKNNTPIGVVGLDMQLKNLNAKVSPIRITKSGESYLLDKNGRYVTNPDAAKLMKINFFEEHNIKDVHSSIGSQDVFFVDNAGNGNYLAARIISDESGWIFVTTGPRKELYASVYHNILIIFMCAVVSIIVSAIIALFAARPIIRPIINVDKTINGIASGNADLTQRIAVTSDDEVGSLVKGFNKFTEKLQEIIGDVKRSKGTLSHAGDDLIAALEETSSSITEILANIQSMHNQINYQSDSVSQTAGAVNEIASNIESLEHMIDHQSSGVAQASAAVEQMIGNIRSVNTSVEKMASSFESLQTTAKNGLAKQMDVNERIEQIENQSQMLQEANKTIANIAEQTNLLAMNAAIEAAHAGESGKGFSVVADEIRKLSETSSVQSKTIGEQLTNIQNAISSVVSASSESSEAFSSVSDKIHETDELVRLIKSAMVEQNEGSKQISEALHTMNDSTIEVHSASAEMSEGNKAILEEVRNLQNATTAMKTSMEEMNIGASKINETGVTLNEVAQKMKESIHIIGNQIDQFKV